MIKNPLELEQGDVIRITSATFTGYDIDVTVTSVRLPIFRDGTARIHTEELKYPLAVAEDRPVEVVG